VTLVVNLVRTVLQQSFFCCCWRNPWCDYHVTHTPRCNESAKIRGNDWLWLNNTDCLCFPCAAYELQHSSDLALLIKWPVFLHNAFGNPTYVNQTNLNGKLRKKLAGGANGGPNKNLGGHGPPRPPLRIATEHEHWVLVGVDSIFYRSVKRTLVKKIN